VKRSPRSLRSEPVVDGSPTLTLSAEEREHLADILAELLLQALGTATPDEAAG
jgi:hypothetical protein